MGMVNKQSAFLGLPSGAELGNAGRVARFRSFIVKRRQEVERVATVGSVSPSTGLWALKVQMQFTFHVIAPLVSVCSPGSQLKNPALRPLFPAPSVLAPPSSLAAVPVDLERETLSGCFFRA